jgi:hypothetical protein
VTGRALSVVVALMLAPAVARSEPSPDPAEQKPGEASGTAAPAIPPKLMERTDFTLTLTTLDALHKKGMMTDEEYAAALRDLITVGQRAATAPTFVLARFVTTFYGYLEGDAIHDTQRAVNDSYGGHPSLNLPGTVPGDNGRTTFSSRGTRLGIRFAAPEVSGVRVRGLFEMDFVGNAPGNPGARPPTQTEASFFTNPTPRLRHGLMQVDTDIVTFWIGQTWNLMAFAAAFLPTSVQPQGLPGQLFGRNPQVRLSRIFDAKAFSIEVAGAAVRPPQMNSEIPDLQGGLKLNVAGWTGVQSIGSTATTISPASVAVTGALRWFKLAPAAAVNGVSTGTNTTSTTSVTGSAIAVDAFVPVIPAKERGNLAISLLGEATTGSGYSDLFSGLTGGAGVGQPTGVSAANYAAFQDVDAGMVGWDTSGVLRTVNWRTLLLDAQISYGKVILAGNYSNVYSDNVQSFSLAGGTAPGWYQQTWWDANLIVDPWPGVRFGLEYARTLQRKVGGALTNNSRLFFAGFFLF